MRTKTYNVFEYHELNEYAKEKARDWFRTMSADDEWWNDGCFDTVVNAATFLGITITTRRGDAHSAGAPQPKHVSKGKPCIYFSGFGNQGDGACFHGTWHADMMKHTLEELTAEFGTEDLGLLCLYKRLSWYRGAYPDSSCTSSGNVTIRYSHEHSTYIEAELGSGVVYTSNTTQHGRELEECLRDFMRWIYALLKEEDQYRNSDEAVANMILSNEYEFSETGRRA